MGTSSSISNTRPDIANSTLAEPQILETWSLIVDKENPSPQFLFLKEVEDLPFQTTQEWFTSVFFSKFYMKFAVSFDQLPTSSSLTSWLCLL